MSARYATCRDSRLLRKLWAPGWPPPPSITHPAGSLTEIYTYTQTRACFFRPISGPSLMHGVSRSYLMPRIAPPPSRMLAGEQRSISRRGESHRFSLSPCFFLPSLCVSFLFFFSVRSDLLNAVPAMSSRAFRLYRAARVWITRGYYRAIVNFADRRLRGELLVPVNYPQAAAFNWTPYSAWHCASPWNLLSALSSVKSSQTFATRHSYEPQWGFRGDRRTRDVRDFQIISSDRKQRLDDLQSSIRIPTQTLRLLILAICGARI